MLLTAAGVGVAAALSFPGAPLSATDYKQAYLDRVMPSESSTAPPPPREPTPEERAALTALLREDLSSWHSEVFGPLAFTNRTCVRMRQTFLSRCAGLVMRSDLEKLQRSILSVRRGMLERARTFVARTENVRGLHQLLVRTLELHVSWMERVTDQHFDVTVCPAPPELVEAKRAFTQAYAPYRRLLEPRSAGPEGESDG